MKVHMIRGEIWERKRRISYQTDVSLGVWLNLIVLKEVVPLTRITPDDYRPRIVRVTSPEGLHDYYLVPELYFVREGGYILFAAGSRDVAEAFVRYHNALKAEDRPKAVIYSVYADELVNMLGERYILGISGLLI